MFSCTIRFGSRIAYHRSNNYIRQYCGEKNNLTNLESARYAFNPNNENTVCSIKRIKSNDISIEKIQEYKTWTNQKLKEKPIVTATITIKDEKGHSSISMSRQNRLAHEKSPYLLQHANNPVDWYPWGDEAIEKARQENKVIFLSVGYSTCHWCHVMEKESFENEDVAAVLNEHFINIKVDREERPDIDKIYMQFLLMVSESGGWPMSVWLTPDLTPITAGTYFPPTDRYGMPGFLTVLKKIDELWRLKDAELITSGGKIIDLLSKSSNEPSENKTEKLVDTIDTRVSQAIQIYRQRYDTIWGGFGGKPKFPEVPKLNSILNLHNFRPDSDVAHMTLQTLRHIANGGIHDHVFGGFCRYSVDREWHIPHFEKMLYDQGQLLSVYANAYKMTRDKFYLDVCEKIYKYLITDLRHPKGGFFCGEDADSYPRYGDADKIEGAFYAWKYAEIKRIFDENIEQFADGSKNALDVFSFYYGIESNGNVPKSSDPQGHLDELNILRVRTTIDETAKKFNQTAEMIKSILENGTKLLYNVRKNRPRPHLDTKILTAWNGLVLSGLSTLACISNGPQQQKYIQTAKELVEFLKINSYNTETKRLIRSCYGEGVDNDIITQPNDVIDGFLDDYAFLIKGLIDFYIATLDSNALRWAKELQDKQNELFWDNNNGGYFYSMENASNVIVRLKDDHDGAEPCGNSVSVRNLILISAYFGDKWYKNERAYKVFDYFSSVNPFSYVLPEMFSAQLMKAAHLAMIVVIGPKNEASMKFIEIARQFYMPNMLLIHYDTDEPIEALTRPAVTKFKMIQNKSTVYFCHNRVCQLPITSPDDFNSVLLEKYKLIE